MKLFLTLTLIFVYTSFLKGEKVQDFPAVLRISLLSYPKCFYIQCFANRHFLPFLATCLTKFTKSVESSYFSETLPSAHCFRRANRFPPCLFQHRENKPGAREATCICPNLLPRNASRFAEHTSITWLTSSRQIRCKLPL